MDKVEYSSDSDQSDEDFCPDNVGSDVPSEEESDYDDLEDTDETTKKGKLKKRGKLKTSEDLSPPRKNTVEKDELESDEDDKTRSNALWAEFLSDVSESSNTNDKKAQNINEKSSSEPSSSRTISDPKTTKETKVKTSLPEEKPEKIKIKEIVEFAGEEIEVTKEVSAENLKQSSSSGQNGKQRIPHKGPPFKRTSGGLGSVLGQLGKKTKISVLEKSKLDWNSFKDKEGLNEELQSFNKGRDGYLERQDFLQRTDLRQFEIEKNLRQSKKGNH